MSEVRYCIGRDNSGHTYIVPVDRSAEWAAWLEIDEGDERAWEPPEFARIFEGLLTFADPRDGHGSPL